MNADPLVSKEDERESEEVGERLREAPVLAVPSLIESCHEKLSWFSLDHIAPSDQSMRGRMLGYFWLLFDDVSRRPAGFMSLERFTANPPRLSSTCSLSLISTFHRTAQKTSSGAWECTSDSQWILPSIPSTLVLICLSRMHVDIN